MEHTRSLSHTKWECKYHIVWIPKYRNRSYGQLRQYLGELFKELAAQKEWAIIEGHLLSDTLIFDLYTPQICGSPGSGVSQGKECDPHCPGLSGTKKELCRSTFLGQGILCFNRGQG